MCITYYSYPEDKDKQLSKHFKMGEFVSDSDYSNNYPHSVPIHDRLVDVLEDVYSHFGATCGIICSGYRTPECDIEVGGSGSGPHTLGIAVDVYYYKNVEPIPSRLIACYLQDIGIKGIGLNCGGNPNGTHFDMRGYGIWEGSVWFGDEVDYSSGYNNYYSYTNTSKSEVYPNNNSNTNVSSSSTSSKNKKTSQSMVDIIKEQEGLSLRACKAIPSEEYWSIGYGHYGAEVRENQTITESEAEALLKKDLEVFENCVNSVIKTDLTQSQFDACISLSYNIGIGAFENSDIVKFINSGKLGHACVDFPSWRKAGGQILPGLYNRRQLEMEYFGVGEDFTLTDNMNVRSGASTSSQILRVSQLTENGKENAVNKTLTANAIFEEGTVVTALELKSIHHPNNVEVWLRCPSGWICIRQGNEVYVN